MLVQEVKSGPVVGAIFKETIAGPALGMLLGYVLQFVMDRMYNDQMNETNMFIVAPFLLYFLCDNQWYNINGVLAMVALGLSVSNWKITYHHREAELAATSIWNFF